MHIVNGCLLKVYPEDIVDGAFHFPTPPNSVTSIGDGAFRDCTGLTMLTIPASVTSIGDYAFYGSAGLTKLTIPASVTSIGYGAFRDCTGLTTLTIPAAVTSIGDYAFYDCTGLTTLTIPAAVASIGNGAFRGCSGFTTLTIPASVTSIGSDTFTDCSGLTQLIIPASVTSIGNCAFYGCARLTTLTIPASVTSIGNAAFAGCTGLTALTIPGLVTSIEADAFYGCRRLTQLTIPASVTSIGKSAFYGCSSLVIVIDTNDQQQFTRVRQMLVSAQWWGVVLTKVAGEALTTFYQNYVPPHLLGVKAIIDDLKPKVGAFLSEAQSMRVRMCVVTRLAAIPLLQNDQQTYPEALATIVNDHMSQHMRHLSHRTLLRQYQRTLIKKVNEGAQYTNCNGVVFFASPKPPQHTALWLTYQVIGKLLDYLDEATATLELDAKEKALIQARSILMKCLPEDVRQQLGFSSGDSSLTAAGPGQ